MWHMFRELFARVDCVVTPCMAVPPFPVSRTTPTDGRKADATYVDWIAPTFVLSMTGLPVASVPCGLDARGMPVGLQIVGPPLGEELVLAVAAAMARLRPVGTPTHTFPSEIRTRTTAWAEARKNNTFAVTPNLAIEVSHQQRPPNFESVQLLRGQISLQASAATVLCLTPAADPAPTGTPDQAVGIL